MKIFLLSGALSSATGVKRLGVRVCLSIALPLFAAWHPAAAAAQARAPITVAQMEVIAKMPEAQQRLPAQQAVLQDWFLYRIEAFRGILNGTAIGTQVRFGDMATVRARMSPPIGKGDWVFLWVPPRVRRDGALLGPTKEPGEPFKFPNDMVKSFVEPGTITHRATCWHEAQHGFLGDHKLRAPGPDPVDQEHFYTDGYAESTLAWLLKLTDEQSFEKDAAAAAALADSYRARGAKVGPEEERSIWTRTHEKWLAAWPKVKEMTALPDVLRQEDLALTGTEMPRVEDVIRFYMEGGVRTAAGAPIKVPEWVFNPNLFRLPVAIEQSVTGKPVLAGPILRQTFGITARSVYRMPGNSMYSRYPITRGTLRVRLETDDDDATLALSVGDKPLAGQSGPGGASLRYFVVPLATYKADLDAGKALSVTLVQRHVDRLVGKKAYQVTVDFVDAKDATGDLLFNPSQAKFWVDITGSAAPAVTSPKPQPGMAARATTSGAFVLTRQWTDSPSVETYVYVGNSYKPASSGAEPTIGGGPVKYASATNTSSTVTYHVMIGSAKKKYTFRWTWPDAPTVVYPGSWLLFDTKRGALWTQREVSPVVAPASWLFFDVKREALDDVQAYGYDGGGFNVANQALLVEYARVSQGFKSDWDEYIKGYRCDLAPIAGDQFTIRFLPIHSATGVATYWQYEWRPAQAAPTGAVQSEATSVVRQDPAPPPTVAKEVDNVPPDPGEVVPVTVKPPPPPSVPATSSTRWFVHAAGAYRFQLGTGWSITRQQPNGTTDTVSRDDKGILIYATRTLEKPDSTPDSLLLSLLVTKVTQSFPTGTVSALTLAGVPAKLIGVSKPGEMDWFVCFAYQGTPHVISLKVPGGTEKAPFPDAVQRMLDSIEFLLPPPSAPVAKAPVGMELFQQASGGGEGLCRCMCWMKLVGARGFEPLTPAV